MKTAARKRPVGRGTRHATSETGPDSTLTLVMKIGGQLSVHIETCRCCNANNNASPSLGEVTTHDDGNPSLRVSNVCRRSRYERCLLPSLKPTHLRASQRHPSSTSNLFKHLVPVQGDDSSSPTSSARPLELSTRLTTGTHQAEGSVKTPDQTRRTQQKKKKTLLPPSSISPPNVHFQPSAKFLASSTADPHTTTSSLPLAPVQLP